MKASAQVSLKAVVLDESTNRTYSTIRPDMVITDAATGCRVPVDVKYRLYDSMELAPADVYQLFTYAYALGSAEDHRRAGLIYAAVSTSSGPNLRITPMTNVTSAQIRAAGLNVASVLEDLAAGSVGAVYTLIRNRFRT